LHETNWLGFLSGAPRRLYARRENRSLDFLSNFRPRPPVEDKSKHVADRYLDVLKPLKIDKTSERKAKLTARPQDLEFTEKLWRKHKLDGNLTIGLFPGAGHPSRRWQLEKFGELADFLMRNDNLKVAVFLGPEEKELRSQIHRNFPKEIVIFDDLTLPQLVAAESRLSVFVSNDTGPMHLAAAVETPIVLLLEKTAPLTYLPLTKNLRVLQTGKIKDIEVEAVYRAVRELLVAERVAGLMI
jgi:ADP-heptose:LPS heptosyltransferase